MQKHQSDLTVRYLKGDSGHVYRVAHQPKHSS